MKKLWDFKKGFSNLELEGQGHGIIMGVTRLLLLGPFYSIQTNFLYFFAHDCTIIPKSALFWLLVATSVTEYYLMHQVGEVLYFLAKKASIVAKALIRSNCTGWNYFWRNIVKVNILLEGHKNFKKSSTCNLIQNKLYKTDSVRATNCDTW